MHGHLLKCDYSLGIYRVPAPLPAGANSVHTVHNQCRTYVLQFGHLQMENS